MSLLYHFPLQESEMLTSDMKGTKYGLNSEGELEPIDEVTLEDKRSDGNTYFQRSEPVNDGLTIVDSIQNVLLDVSLQKLEVI